MKDKIWGNQNEMVKFNLKDHLIIHGYRGSMAHNLYIPPEEKMSTDDVDWMGIVIAPLDYYFGDYVFEGTEYWDGNDDIVLYDLRKFIRLLTKANPNVLSLLWNRPDMFTYLHPVSEILFDNRDIFSTKQAFKSFGGYANSQLHKMFNGSNQGYMGAKRKKLVKEFGYDCKNASHLIRLLKMGVEFLSTGQMTVYRVEDRQELIDIKQGKWSANKVQLFSKALFEALKYAYENSPLPDKPDRRKVNDILMRMMKEYHASLFR